jgi:hypothetical protein
MTKKMSKLFLLATVVVLWSGLAAAQGVATGDLHVTVRDPKGSVVTNATITTRDQAKAYERSTTLNVGGEYRFVALPPGTYTVTIEAAGFAKAEAQDVRITVGQMAELPVALQVAGTQTVITVSSEAEVVETQRTSSTATIEQRRIENLPTNGRNYINFALTDSRLARDTAPSIGAAPTSGLNVGGQRARANLVNVDGADAVDNSTNGIRSTISQEGVQEFQVITSGYAAEYGRASGGVVNIITRSGSNDFHGSVYGYVRNRNFQAVNPFSTVSNPAFTRVQTGVAFGGPIKKDKTYYFFSWEGTWRQETGFSSIGGPDGKFGLVNFDASAYFGQPAGVVNIQATPDQAQFLASPPPVIPVSSLRQYIFLIGAASGVATSGSQPAIFAAFPFAPPGSGLQQFPTTCGGANTICAGLPASFVELNRLRGNFPVSERTDLYSLRLDHNFSSNQRISLRGGVSPSDVTGIQVQAQGPQNFGQNAFSRTSNQNFHDWNFTGQDTWTIGDNRVNEFRFQYSRRGLLYGFARNDDGSKVAVNIPGVAFFGREPFSFVRRKEQRYQLTDNFSWSRGSHNIKFGFDTNFLPISADFTVNFGGIFNFGQQSLFPSPFPALSPVQAYGAGIPSNFIQGVGNPHDAFSNTTVGGFIQDSWRIKSNLTMNYGVRYDAEFTPQFAAINGLAKQGQDFLGITQGIPRDFNNFAPRVGISWDPFKDGKTKISANYGLFYDHPLLGLAFIADVADGAQAPQFVLFPGAPCSNEPGKNIPNPLNLNASNVFQGIVGRSDCTPPGLADALTYLPDQQRFDPTPNTVSAWVNQNYIPQNPAAGVPLAALPFGFPNAKAFKYAASHQANLTFERDLGNNLSLSLEYNFNGGRHLNRPINTNTVLDSALIGNWQAAATDPTSGALTRGPLGVGTVGNFCQQADPIDATHPSWVAPALANFFRPSGLNATLARALIGIGQAGCVGQAQALLAAAGLNANCDPIGLSNCGPFGDMPANTSNGSSVYHGLTANLRKRFGKRWEFLASYTWSHAIDDSTDLQSPLSPQDNYNPDAERSNSTFDQRHRFVFSSVFQSGKVGGSGFVSKLLSDWTLAPIIEAVSGRPFNIIVGDDRNFDFGSLTDRPLAVPAGTPDNFCGDKAVASKFSPTGFLQPACFANGTLIGNIGRNSGTKPTDVFTDIRIARTLRFGDRFRLEAAADVFNLINRFNVADVNPLWTNAGQKTAAFDPRQVQISLRLGW